MLLICDFLILKATQNINNNILCNCMISLFCNFFFKYITTQLHDLIILKNVLVNKFILVIKYIPESSGGK